MYLLHIVRSAATSKATQHLYIAEIIKNVGWRNDSTFQRFYKKEGVVQIYLASPHTSKASK